MIISPFNTFIISNKYFESHSYGINIVSYLNIIEVFGIYISTCFINIIINTKMLK